MAPKHLSCLALLAFPLVATASQCTDEYFEHLLPSNASLTFTQVQAAGSTFQVPADDIAYPTSPHGLPSLCAVQINVTSSPTSAYSFGLFLPDSWNARFLAVGNGGFAGGINWLDMAAGVGYGFASMSTDTGHNSTSIDLTWAANAPEKQIDFGYRAMHGSVELAKQIVAAYYGCGIDYSYYSGCSTGGRQGLKEVQMFPDDFDGALVGAPAWWSTHLSPATTWQGLYNLPVEDPKHIPEEMFPVIAAEVLKQCDGQDGVVDNIISDPPGCNFYPEAMLCGPNVTNETAAGCLTSAQIGTLYHIYNDWVDVNQTFVFPHFQLGSEMQWPIVFGGDTPNPLGYEYEQYFLGLGSNWSFYDLDYSVVQLADATDPGNLTAGDFNMSPFHDKGGKLLMYHGYADGLIPTGSSIYYYKQVVDTFKPKGIELDSWYRFFLVPGMQHCVGTPDDVNAPWYFAGGNQAGTIGTEPGAIHSTPGFEDPEHDALLALMRWTEKGEAPDKIIATKWDNDTLAEHVYRQRPLCVFPKVAKFLGGGADPNNATSWYCDYLYQMHTQQ